MSERRTQIVIIGGGPSGLLLSQLLHKRGIQSVVLERKSKDYVLSRIRAGVLERGLLGLMEEAGIGGRMAKEGFAHDGTLISYGDEMFRIDFKELTGHSVMVYGQTEVTRDLYDAREAMGGQIEYNVEEVEIHDLESDAATVTYRKDGQTHKISCDFVAGCDGYHGLVAKPFRARFAKNMRKSTPLAGLEFCRARLRSAMS